MQELTGFAVSLVAPWPEEVDAKESDCSNDGYAEEDADRYRCALLCRVVLDREPFFTICDGNFIEFRTELSQFILAHSPELLFRVILFLVRH